GVVAATRRGQTLGQRLDWRTLPQLRPVGRDQEADARRGRIVSYKTHCSLSPQIPVEMSIDWPSTRVTIAFLTSLRTPLKPRKRFVLRLRTSVLTAFTLTEKRP